jgi:ABC-type branched-subunit amino acid transport system substrate-binding protein
MMHYRWWRLLLPALAAVLLTTGCGRGASATGATAGRPTYTVGVLTDLTGPGAASNGRGVELGVRAGIGGASRTGFVIRYVLADTGSSPGGALTAAQELVEQHHVFAVIAISAFTFGASRFLAAHDVPVVGIAVDGSEWNTSPNMFSVLGSDDFAQVDSTIGLMFKRLGATDIASVGYGLIPLSADATRDAALSAQAAGQKVGYLDAAVPFATSDVGPLSLEIAHAKVNGLFASLLPTTEFSLLQALRLQRQLPKVVLMATGYGDLSGGGPDASGIAQGLYFYVSYEPVELHTEATRKFTQALKTYAGVTGEPTFFECLGYVSINALLEGLHAAGPHPSQAQLIDTMDHITGYDAAGLLGGNPISWVPSERDGPTGYDRCVWVTQYIGRTFRPVPSASPICGHLLASR